MTTKTQLERQALWNRLKPRYRLLVCLPCLVGLSVMISMLYPEGLWLSGALGISAHESVNQHPNGQVFVLAFGASFIVTLGLGAALAYGVISWWLVKVSGYTRAEVRLAMMWRAYPAKWLKGGEASSGW